MSSSFHSSLTQAQTHFMDLGKSHLKEIAQELLPQRAVTTTNQGEVDYVFSILYIIGLILLAFLIIFIQGFFVKTLWNFVIPTTFGIKDPKKARLTWLTGISLLILFRILFF